MREGWVGDDYLILFEAAEIEAASDAYLIAPALPGYKLVGLRGWDDFLVRNLEGQVFAIPTVPLDPKYLVPSGLMETMLQIEPDERWVGRVKLYVKPLVFGGVPSEENQAWVNHDDHARLVRYWNDVYNSARPA